MPSKGAGVVVADYHRNGRPALLVSVRDATEAVAALKGGCDILDIKDPSRGPLGMASVPEIGSIVSSRDALARSIPVSVALGELRDCLEFDLPRLPSGISFVKFGTSRLAGGSRLPEEFTRFRERILEGSGVTGTARAACGCIAVAYADWQAAIAPPPVEVAEAAIRSGCNGLLIDTFCKTSGGLFENLSVQDLKVCGTIVRQAGRTFALAGRLRITDVARAIGIGTDILGIRSAACREERRELEIDPRAVERFQRAIGCALAGTGVTSEPVTAPGGI